MGSEGEAEADSEDQIVTDELLDDDTGTDDAEAGGDGILDESDVADVSIEEQDTQDKTTSHKRSHSKSPVASHEKDDFDDEELDSDVDETG